MAVLLFIIILAVLIFAHELGHFLVAKYSGVRVDEFSVGFPPRIWKKKVGETQYSIGAIPFGGYVSIHGENPDEESLSGADSERSLVNKPCHVQASVLVAGVTFNMLLAWLLISLSFMGGYQVPVSYSDDLPIKNPQMVIVNVFEGAPAESAGLSAGDIITSLSIDNQSIQPTQIADLQNFISQSNGAPIAVGYTRQGESLETVVAPEKGIIGETYGIGIAPEIVGTVQLNLIQALWQGYRTTGEVTLAILVGFGGLIADIFQGQADFSGIAGPIGIVGLIGDASQFGWTYLLGFTAFISINLAILNLLPLPALDGGRLLVLLIESIIRRRIKPTIINAIHAMGFALLILLMIAVTFNDIARIF